METITLKIGQITFEKYKYSKYLDIWFIEHSPDPWYSDTETNYPMDMEEVQQLVDFLRKVYPEVK